MKPKYFDINKYEQKIVRPVNQDYNQTMQSNHQDELNHQEVIFFDTKQAAGFLGISRRFLLNLTSDGRIPYFKFGRNNRYLKNELMDLILSNRRGLMNGHKKR